MTRYRERKNPAYCTSNEAVVMALAFTPTQNLVAGDEIYFDELPANHAIVDATTFIGSVNDEGQPAELMGLHFDLGFDALGQKDCLFVDAQPAPGMLLRLNSSRALRDGALSLEQERGLLLTIKSGFVIANGGTLHINLMLRARQLGH